MKKTFWTCFAFALLFSTALQAKIYSSPFLNEAHKLLTINPKQSLDMTKQFMAKRKLVSTKSQDYTLSRDGGEKNIRTPSASVEALQIMAKAYFELGYKSNHLAFVALKEAETLSQQYKIIQPQLDTQLVKAELLWRLDKNPDDVLPMLTDIMNQAQQKGINNNWKQETLYQVYMLQAEISAFLDDEVNTQNHFQQALTYLNNNKSTHLTIDYHLRLGEYYLSQKKYDDSLTELLTTYWLAIKESDSVELARTNLLLSRLFFTRHVLDKALEHATEAADFYDNYPSSAPLSATLKLMADIYFKQEKYNFALANYLNVLDNESGGVNIDHIIQLRIDIANTYLKLLDFTHAEIYLQYAQTLVKHATNDDKKAEILLLQASLALPQNKVQKAMASSEQALNIALKLQNKPLQMQAYQIMSEAYQQNKDYQQALQAQQKYLQLWQNQQERFNAVNEEVFRQQKDIIEKSLHYAGLEDKLLYLNTQYAKYQRATMVAMLVSFLLLCLVIHRGYRNQKMRDEIEKQTIDLYTHPRSGLQNLRLLNSKLSQSLERSNAVFEQWRLGELIHEPLSDRLSFVMFDLPFLRNIYLKLGYQTGLRIEKEFGEYLKPLISKPARLYHFSDGLFLYIEPKSDNQAPPEHFYEKIKDWINGFDFELPLDKHFKMGMAEYPFLPRAYTAINDKDLIDILFMTLYLARRIYDRYPDESAHWVYLSAIEHAPAASFASDNIRHAFEQAIEQGLIKIHTSGGHDDLAKAILRNDDHSNLD